MAPGGKTVFERLSTRQLAANIEAEFAGVDTSAVETFIAFRRFSCRVSSFFGRHWIRHGVSNAGAMALIQLFHSKGRGLRPSEIAVYEHVSRATVTGVLSSLEKQGLILRRHDAADRRSFRVFLSVKGKRLLARVLPEGLGKIVALVSILSAGEQKRFRKALKRLDVMLDRIEAGA